MKILVTGGAGFIGTNLIKRLLKGGNEVVSVDNYSTGLESNHINGCEYIKVDLSGSSHKHRDWHQEKFRLGNFDVIFHLAAIARIQPSFKHPIQTFSSNTTATLNILEWARHNQTPVIYAGSSSSNGDKFSNPYTLSKSHGEELVKLYNKVYDLPTSICRFYNVYGEHQLTEGDYCTLIGIFERLHKEGKPFVVTGDGEQRRDFTHVDDIVDGLVRCSWMIGSNRSNKVNGEIFELGRGKNYSVNEIVDAFGKNYQTQYIDARPGEMRETLNTDTKAKDVLGWKPKVDIIKYIKENYILDK